MSKRAGARTMLEAIELDAQMTASVTGRNTISRPVMEAIASICREKFVRKRDRSLAYCDEPLPIGHGQTISQPFIVALMTDLLEVTPESEVLEIGTGSGFQAAVLSRLAKKVYSVECVEALANSARQRLYSLGYLNVEVAHKNGFEGWLEKAPFDRIIVTAAAASIPPVLIDQLKPGGIMVIPIGQPDFMQHLTLVRKLSNGELETQSTLPVVFVPMVDEITKQE